MADKEKENKDQKKVVLNSDGDSSADSSDVTKVGPAAGDDTTSSEAAASPEQNKGRRTIKLKPIKPAGDEDARDTVSLSREEEDDETVKIQRPAQKSGGDSAEGPTVPGTKQTIKLRPSSTAAGAAASTPPPAPPPAADESSGNKAAKRTIKLVPKGKEESAAAPAAPSSPTVQMPEGQAASPAAPSSPTVQMSEPEAPPAQEPTSTKTSAKRTLKLKTTQKAPPPSQAALDTDTEGVSSSQEMRAPQAKAATSDEPSIIFTLVACAAFFVMAYMTWMTAGQFSELYLEVNSANVPGLSGKVQ